MADTGGSWDFVESTFPLVPLPQNSQREPIRTRRLIIRPLQESDIESFHELRSQPEAMTGTTRGVPDKDISESQEAMRDFMPPKDKKAFLFGVFLASTGELIGEGGVHTLQSSHCGWPEIGYKFKKEFWGQGYATEFLSAFLQAWWALPRSYFERKVCLSSIDDEESWNLEVTEQVCAIVDANNVGSLRVLKKVGFTEFEKWEELDTQEHRISQQVKLVGYRCPKAR